MATKQALNEPTQTVASPVELQSRRDSIASVSAREQVDKRVLAQALDQVHSTARQSEKLTSFDEFAPPPPPQSINPKVGKNLSLQLTHSSLGNIYSRLKASVGPLKDSSPPISPSRTSLRSPESTHPSTSQLTTVPPANATYIPAASVLSQEGDSDVKSPVSSTGLTDDQIAANLSCSPAASDSALLLQRPIEYDATSHDAISLDAAISPAKAGDVPSVQSLEQMIAPPQKNSGRVSIGNIRAGPTVSVHKPSSQDYRPEGLVHEQQRGNGRGSYSHLHPPSFDESRTASSDDLRSQTSSYARTPRQDEATQNLQPAFKFAPQEPRMNVKEMMLAQMRNKVLSRDFWMKDENAKVCFSCAEQFTTFKRKHHCRLCGQIFCANCTHLISGKPFGQASKLRTCKTCEQVLHGGDSSDAGSFSDDEYGASPHVRHLRFSEPSELALNRSNTVDPSVGMDSPRSGLPLSRAPSLARPSSSRSLKSLGSRPRSSSYRQRRSRHQHMRSLGLSVDTHDGSHKTAHGPKPETDLPAFHTDSIIDPDLAPFLSDEGSSDDEVGSIAGTLAGDAMSPAPAGVSSALKRARPRPLSRGFTEGPRMTRDSDTFSIASSKAATGRRNHPARTLSMSSLARHGTGSRIIRSENLFNQYHFHANIGNAEFVEWTETPIRAFDPNSSMLGFRGIRPIKDRMAELNQASMQHVKTLLYQFLLDSNVQQDPQKWEKALLPILLRCAEDVDPNIQRGDDIDIRHYVKLKRAAGGNPSDTRYVSGVVFTKNVALREMPRSIDHPRILLVAFPIVYARHQQRFMSLDPVIAQEKEYLRNLVNRIIALKPHLLLVQRQVSGLALQFLQDAGIAVVCNVKDSVMHAVSRCTQSKIISSVEKLTMDMHSLGTCEKFDVKTFVHAGLRKSFIFIAGCQADLGCTIFLRGADSETLAKVKYIVEFMCYAVYNLKLETSLLRDQFVSLPSVTHVLADTGTADHELEDRALLNSAGRIGTGARSVITDKQLLDMASEGAPTSRGRKTRPRDKAKPGSHQDPDAQDRITPSTYTRLYQDLERRALSISPLVRLADPYLLLRGAELEAQMQQLLELVNRDDLTGTEEKSQDDLQAFKLIEPSMVYESNKTDSQQIREALRAIHSAEYEKVFHRYNMLKRRWEAYIAGVVNPFSPLMHQRIVLLFSLVSTASNDSCEGPDLLGMDFYHEHDIDDKMEPDVPLGEYVERLIHQAKAPCLASRCEKNMMNHHRQYVHGKGQLRMFIEPQPAKVRGMQSTILMWSVCRICEYETQVVPMSSNSWKYSFAKYLELSFWSDHAIPRAGSCGHDVHRDHSRYFGLNDLALKIQYDPVNIMEVIVPRLRVTWKVEKDLSLKNNQYLKVEERILKFISSVRNRLKTIKIGNVFSDKEDACRAEIERLLKLAETDRTFLVDKAKEKYMASKYFEIIPFNRAMRAMQEKVAEWDKTFTDFEASFFPSEKDLSKLAAAQLSKVYFGDDSSQESLVADQAINEKRNDVHLSPTSVDEKPVMIDNADFSDPSAVTSPSRQAEMSQESLRAETMPVVQKLSDVVDQLDLAVASPAVMDASGAVDIAEVDGGQATVPASSVQTIMSAEDSIQMVPTQDATQVAESQSTPASKANERPGNDSSIPRYVKTKPLRVRSPPLFRSRTQPTIQLRAGAIPDVAHALETAVPKSPKSPDGKGPAAPKSGMEKKLTERLGIGRSKLSSQSMIPRSIPQNRFQSKVSSLAKHFEQLSREFERERIKERRQRAAKLKHSTFYPVASSKPVVEVFKSAYEAVQEHEQSSTELPSLHSVNVEDKEERTDQSTSPRGSAEDRAKVEPAPATKDQPEVATEDAQQDKAYAESFADTVQSDETSWDTNLTVENDITSPAETELDFATDLPRHEKSSLLKLLTSFWSERSASDWAALDYPLVAGEHIFADSDILVREDEPSSLIAFSMASLDYVEKMQGFRERIRRAQKDNRQNAKQDGSSSDDIDVEQTMLGKTATHMKYQFQAGSARMQCKIFYAESFDAIRRKCLVESRFVESLSRCIKWDSKGGKTKSLFLKTLDERFILKSLSAIETQSFLKFAPDYFDYTSKCLFHNLPSALAKIMGLYQVVIKNPLTGIECNEFLLVMENVFYEGPSNRMFDLKGSMRNRKVKATGERDEVLLDENLLDYIGGSPVYIQNHSNSILASSISNDTLFCSKQNVMDYSLIVGLYDDRKELLVGIIDYIRTYTWDKRLESWIKDRGKHKPTVRSPKDYRNRFRASIPRYFPLAPSCWQAFGQQRYDQIGLAFEAARPAIDGVDEVSEEETG